MNDSHPISDDLLDLANMALMKCENWMTYNNSMFYIDKDDVQFFRDKDAAREFARNNISDRDNFSITRIDSIQDIFAKIFYAGKNNELPVSNPDLNGLYNSDRNGFTEALIEHIDKQNLPLVKSQLNINIMNNENFQYLSDNIKYMGFGEDLKTDLEKRMNEGKNEFQLFFNAEINKKPFEATLNFRKSDNSDMYFFNNYHARLEKNNGEKVERTFFLYKGKGVTSKEAFNLLDGRAVHKDLFTKVGQPYKAWTQLDFENKDKNNNFEVKQFHENYGFDLREAVGKFPIAELKDPEKENILMQSLRKGNLQSVTIEKDGNSNKMFIEADPQYKKVTLYDANLKQIAKQELGSYQSVGLNGAKNVKKEPENDKKKDLKKELKPLKEKLGNKNNKSLLPKKREGIKKGLRVV